MRKIRLGCKTSVDPAREQAWGQWYVNRNDGLELKSTGTPVYSRTPFHSVPREGIQVRTFGGRGRCVTADLFIHLLGIALTSIFKAVKP